MRRGSGIYFWGLALVVALALGVAVWSPAQPDQPAEAARLGLAISLLAGPAALVLSRLMRR